MAALGDEDICRLDVAVNNAFDVGGVERIGDLDGQLQQRVGLERARADGVLESEAVEKFHGDEGLRLVFLGQVLVNFVNGADVGMVQSRGGLGLTLKAGEGLRIFSDSIGQEFQSHKAVQLEVFRFVDHAHAPAAELLDQAVVRDGLADHWKQNLTLEREGESMKRSAGLLCATLCPLW